MRRLLSTSETRIDVCSVLDALPHYHHELPCRPLLGDMRWDHRLNRHSEHLITHRHESAEAQLCQHYAKCISSYKSIRLKTSKRSRADRVHSGTSIPDHDGQRFTTTNI